MAVGSIPHLPDRDGMDVVTTMGDEEALEMARRLAKVEGILAGTFAGAATYAALEVAGRLGSASGGHPPRQRGEIPEHGPLRLRERAPAKLHHSR